MLIGVYVISLFYLLNIGSITYISVEKKKKNPQKLPILLTEEFIIVLCSPFIPYECLSLSLITYVRK